MIKDCPPGRNRFAFTLELAANERSMRRAGLSYQPSPELLAKARVLRDRQERAAAMLKAKLWLEREITDKPGNHAGTTRTTKDK